MLVYGDCSREAQVRREIENLRRDVAALDDMRRGLARHSASVALFIRGAELAQGIVDAEFASAGVDQPTPVSECALRSARALAQLVASSWRHGFDIPASPFVSHLRVHPGAPEVVSCRRQEGYAFYGVYPEAYLCAASVLVGRAPTVVGIRSIGLGLGAVLACAAAASLVISVRPVGHPFHRRLALSAETKALLARRRSDEFAIADEGPGLSGSSFAAAAAELEGIGVSPSRIHFFPSHAGEPAGGDAVVRAHWSKVQRHVAGFPSGAPPSLADWCADLTGTALEPLEDIGAGGWRRHRPPPVSEAPAQPTRERSKYLLRSERGVFLLRFVGLGDYGAQCFARAQKLAEAELSPAVLGLRHGFLVQSWLGDAASLRGETGRSQIIARLADYLAFRARRLPAAPRSGALLDELGEMLAVNAREGVGLSVDRVTWRRRAQALESRVRRVQTDNRLHWWEWLMMADGTILKADGYDHCAGHDLVGCQDIAWDVAGAAAEFDLSAAEAQLLCAALRARGVSVDGELLEFVSPCYLAFQLALSEEAASLPHATTIDRERSRSEARRYGLLLKRSLLG